MNPAENTVIASPKLSTRRTHGATILRDPIVPAVPRTYRHKKSGSFFADRHMARQLIDKYLT
jgi:hypothetical protein